MSPRNLSTAVVNMMQKSGCRRLIATCHSLGPLLDEISTEVAGLRIEDPPTLAYTYPELGKETGSSPFVPYPKAEGRPFKDDILCYLHSSGSTGFPKPIPITNLTAVHWCIMREYSFHSRCSSDLIRDQRSYKNMFISPSTLQSLLLLFLHSI